ncbi:MAG: glycosyltransferase [Candidatus Yanofskybacteria bacterium]|nr:glycosyltransferase [Candidatus Yanofskybacteria bacterium]
MHSPKKILFASVHPWDTQFLRAGDHHYAELFAREGYEVCWISNHVSLPHFIRKHYYSWIQSALKGAHTTRSVLSYTPFTLLPFVRIPPFNSVWVGKHHLRFAIPPLHTFLKSHGFHEVDILVMSNVSLFYLSHAVAWKKFALRITDDLAGIPAAQNMLSLQESLIQKADSVFVTSRELMKYNPRHQKNFRYLPNAVDLDHFKGARSLPAEYATIPSPRVLYVGSLFEGVDRVDLNLISVLARTLPSYNFVFVGPTSISLSHIKKQHNIHILGPRRYEDIPAYMKHADVAIIPFKENILTKAMSAMKLFQYLAAGLPVVSSRMQELAAMNPPVSFATGYKEFAAAIENAYRGGKDYPEFFAFAEKNSWADRYKSMKEALGI